MAKIPRPQIDSFNPAIYYCQRAKREALIDGNLDKEFWQDAPWSADFVDIEGDAKAKPRYQTRMKMLWDDHYLYVAAELMGDEIWANITEHDAVIFQDNDFEIFLDPSSRTQPYYEFEMNALNTTWDLLLPKPYRDGGDAVNGFEILGLQSAVKIDGELNNPHAQNRSWSVEIALPFKAFANYHRNPVVRPATGSFWRINFSRVHWNVDVIDGRYVKKNLPEENWVWSPMGVINMHYPELWGFLFFCEDRFDYAIPEDEKLKWQLRTIYYKEHQYFEEHGCFSGDLQADDPHLEVRVQVSDSWFELSCPSSDGQKRIYLYADGNSIIK